MQIVAEDFIAAAIEAGAELVSSKELVRRLTEAGLRRPKHRPAPAPADVDAAPDAAPDADAAADA